MATHAIEQGNILGRELKVEYAQEMKVQAAGSGSYRIYGRLKKDGAPKPLTLINLSGYDMSDTGTDDNIYTCDVAGLYSIFADDAAGDFDEIYAEAHATT